MQYNFKRGENMHKDIEEIFKQLRYIPVETEWIEFKEAKNNYDFDKLGKYFSALSNEANLNNKDCGWLIFGVEDKKRIIVGTKYRENIKKLESLKTEIANKTNDRMTFLNIYELNIENKRVVMFQIPAATKGVPTSWEGHYYGRDSENLHPLSLNKLERIRKQIDNYDWSGEIIQDATIQDLDEKAIEKARKEYIGKHPHLEKEVNSWNDITFLNKSGVCINGNITNTAMILLGKEEKSYLLGNCAPQITWVLQYTNKITPEDYTHFKIPFILSIDEVLSRIRNLTYRYIPRQTTLFPIEIPKYEAWVLREALNNCIAHQDYSKQGRITIVESEDEVSFSNYGHFYPETVENAITAQTPPQYYRNKWLANAMVELNMIDTIGSGIKRMYQYQRERYFPLPTYDLSDYDKVSLTIMGKILNEKYTEILAEFDMDLNTVIILDKIQKGIKISKEDYNIVKKQNLVEGRYPNIYLSKNLSEETNEKERYIRNKAFDDKYYKDLIINFIGEYKKVKRSEIDNLLIDKISDVLSIEQKKRKIKYMLDTLKSENVIVNEREGSNSYWKLLK